MIISERFYIACTSSYAEDMTKASLETIKRGGHVAST